MAVFVNGNQVSGGGPPSGAASGALAGTYPGPTLNPADTAGNAVLKGTLTTAGDLIGASAANTPARVVPAAAGTVLTSNGVGVAATFQAAGAGTAIPNAILTAIGDIVSASGVATPAVIPATTSGLILTANGAGTQSTYQTNVAIAQAAAAQATANAAIPKALVTAIGDLVSSSAVGVPAVIPAVGAGRVLLGAGVATLPAYSTLTIPTTVAQGDLLIASAANALTALAAGAADTFVGGNGTVPQARTAAQVRTSLGVVDPTTYNYSSSTGFVTSAGSGGGAASITGGIARVTIAAATIVTFSAGGFLGPRVEHAMYGALALVCRVAAYTGGNSLTRAALYMRNTAGTKGAQVNVWPNGTVETSIDGVSVSSASGVVPLDGTGWLRIVISGGLAIGYGGTGTSTTQPTTWTTAGTLPILSGFTVDTFGTGMGQYDALAAGTITFDADDLTVYS